MGAIMHKCSWEEEMIEFKYAGKAFNLIRYLKDRKGGFEKAMTDVLEEARFDGTFTVTPHSIGRGSAATSGVLRFGASKAYGRGIPCAYHPINLDNGCNISFTLSSVSGMDEMSFLTKLKDAQSALTTPKEEVTMPTISRQLENAVPDIAVDQTALSLVISALRKQVSDLGAEYLTTSTIRECIVKAIACESGDAEVYVGQLVDLGILKQSGKGGKLYTVSSNKGVGEDSSAVNAATDMANFLAELPKTLRRVRELQEGLPKLQKDLSEKKVLLDRCRNRIPVLESEIADLEAQIRLSAEFLSSDGVKAAVQFAEMTKAIQA